MENDMERLAVELRKLIDQNIEALKDSVSAGLLNDMQDYKKLTGQIEGMRMALTLLEMAIENVQKR
jgi:hypothetical protein